MTQRNRQHLKQEFQDGERPSGADFADLMDSFLNLEDDVAALDDDKNMVLAGGLRPGPSTLNEAGYLRFNGTTVQFHDSNDWVDLGSGGGGAFQPVGGTDHVAYTAGNVGIGGAGDFANPPTFRLEVNLGSNTTEGQRVRFGNAVVSNGSAAFQGWAYFYHRDNASNNSYALRQAPTGAVHLNGRNGQPVSIRQNGNQVRLGITANGRVVVGSESELSGSNARFQVSGTACKTSSGNVWLNCSDARVKEDVRDLDAGLDELRQVRPIRFRYNGKAGTTAGEEGVGILAQEIEAVFPEMVQRTSMRLEDDPDGEGLRFYDGSALTFVLVNAVKELTAKVETLEAALAAAGPGE